MTIEIEVPLYDWTLAGMKRAPQGHWIERKEVERLMQEAIARDRQTLMSDIEKVVRETKP